MLVRRSGVSGQGGGNKGIVALNYFLSLQKSAVVAKRVVMGGLTLKGSSCLAGTSYTFTQALS